MVQSWTADTSTKLIKKKKNQVFVQTVLCFSHFLWLVEGDDAHENKQGNKIHLDLLEVYGTFLSQVS